MKILVVGGGSGGHITPAMSVVQEILKMKPKSKIEFWTDAKYYKNVVKLANEAKLAWGGEEETGVKLYLRVRKVFAGKFHRYHGLKMSDYFDNHAKTFFDVVFGNIAGAFGFAMGFFQTLWRFSRKENRPDVIFLKGGFVGLPVGIVAGIFKIPYLIHESDATMGLANRILSKKAKIIAMGTPVEKEDSRYVFVGIPVGKEFEKVAESKKRRLKRELGFDPERNLVIVTGGSQGSMHINQAIREILPELLKYTSVGLVSGRKHYEDMIDLKKYETWEKGKLTSEFRMWNFSPVMHEILGAGDIVVSRAGATTMAELASLGKPTILVPFEKLPGGHQVKNAEKLARDEAVEMILDREMEMAPEKLLKKILNLLKNSEKQAKLVMNFKKYAKLDASESLAKLVLGLKK